MKFLKVTVKDSLAVVALHRGKSNAMNAGLIDELNNLIINIENDDNIGGLILTGGEGFFSAGLDLIELYDYDETTIKQFWHDFLNFHQTMVRFKKPMVAAISGHAPAGGCVMAIACDYRVMAEGKFIIGLNEVPVGIILPDAIFHNYAFWLGQKNAYQFLMEGKLMRPEQALEVGLVDELCNAESVISVAEKKIRTYMSFDKTTWQQSKLALRSELIDKVSKDQTATLDIMLKQWWSPSTRSILQTIIQNLQKKA